MQRVIPRRGYGWDRARLDGRQGAAAWCVRGVFAHNVVKIGSLASQAAHAKPRRNPHDNRHDPRAFTAKPVSGRSR